MDSNPSFLGVGWSFPPSFGLGGADLATVKGAEDIHQSLEILFGTLPGERILREDYGCDLREFQFEEMDRTLINRLTTQISEAILYHEPRIILDDLEISESGSRDGLLLISLQYTITATNSRYNMVYPFHILESSPSES